MKHTNELKAILTAIFAINKTSEHEDNDITLVLDYAFRRFFGANTNLLILSCIGKTKEQMSPKSCNCSKAVHNTKHTWRNTENETVQNTSSHPLP